MKRILLLLLAALLCLSAACAAQPEPSSQETEAPAEPEAVEEAVPEEELVVIEDEETPLGFGTENAPFMAKVHVKMVGAAPTYFGDTVTLAAVVESASAEYTIRWEFNAGNGWVTCGTGETYTFMVDEQNALYAYRAVVVEKNGNGEIAVA